MAKHDKIDIGISTTLNPVPVVMVSSGTLEKSNICTVAWAGTINSEPPMLSVSLRKSRLSHVDHLRHRRICGESCKQAVGKILRSVWG